MALPRIVNKVQRNADVLLIGAGLMFLIGILPVTSKFVADAGDAVRGMIPGLKKPSSGKVV